MTYNMTKNIQYNTVFGSHSLIASGSAGLNQSIIINLWIFTAAKPLNLSCPLAASLG